MTLEKHLLFAVRDFFINFAVCGRLPQPTPIYNI